MARAPAGSAERARPRPRKRTALLAARHQPPWRGTEPRPDARSARAPESPRARSRRRTRTPGARAGMPSRRVEDEPCLHLPTVIEHGLADAIPPWLASTPPVTPPRPARQDEARGRRARGFSAATLRAPTGRSG